jgi:ornithine cyclodeaminase/alanine dehydrogenase-like protein (mu-crystallin family)
MFESEQIGGVSTLTVLLLGPEDTAGLIGWREGISAMEAAFIEFSNSKVRLSNPRTRTNTPEGFRMTVHQGVTPSLNAGVTSGRGEMVRILDSGQQRYPRRGRPVFILHDSATAELLMIMIGEPTPPGLQSINSIGGYQTACCAAYCTHLIARPEARRVGILGSGGQAKLHLAGLAAVRELDEVVVYSPTDANREAFAKEMADLLGVGISAVDSASEVVRRAEILLVCTNSNVPVLDGSELTAGTHVTSIVHSNKELVEAGLLPSMRKEVDDTTLQRAGLIATTSKAQEELDRPAVLYGASVDGVIDWDDVLEVSDVLRQPSVLAEAHRQNAITFLHNPAGWGIGAGAFIRAYYDRAIEQGKGIRLDIDGYQGFDETVGA